MLLCSIQYFSVAPVGWSELACKNCSLFQPWRFLTRTGVEGPDRELADPALVEKLAIKWK